MQSLYINNATVAQHQQQISGAQELFSALTPSLVRSEKTTKTTKQQQKKVSEHSAERSICAEEYNEAMFIIAHIQTLSFCVSVSLTFSVSLSFPSNYMYTKIAVEKL